MATDGYTDAGTRLSVVFPNGVEGRARAVSSGTVINVVPEADEQADNSFSVTVNDTGNPSTAAKDVAASRAQDEREAERPCTDVIASIDADGSQWSVSDAAAGHQLSIAAANRITDRARFSRYQPVTGLLFQVQAPVGTSVTCWWYSVDTDGNVSGPANEPGGPSLIPLFVQPWKVIVNGDGASWVDGAIYNSVNANGFPFPQKFTVYFKSGPNPGGGGNVWRIRNIRTTGGEPPA